MIDKARGKDTYKDARKLIFLDKPDFDTTSGAEDFKTSSLSWLDQTLSLHIAKISAHSFKVWVRSEFSRYLLQISVDTDDSGLYFIIEQLSNYRSTGLA